MPGTDLARVAEVRPDRAGSIVAELVHAIVEEAQESAIQMIREAAEEHDGGQREALDSADRMRAHIDEMAGDLESAAAQLREESKRLASLRQLTTAASVTGGAAVEDDTGEQLALAQVASGYVRAEPVDDHHDHDEGPHDVEVVGHGDEEPGVEEHHEPVDAEAEEEPEAAEEPEAEEPEAAAEDPHVEAEDEPQTLVEEPDAEDGPYVEPEDGPYVEPEDESYVEPEDEPQVGAAEEPAAEDEPPMAADEPQTPVEEPHTAPAEAPHAAADDSERLSAEDRELEADHAHFAPMDDAELALAYTEVIGQLKAEPDREQADRMLRFAGAALGEALTRPGFADLGQGAPPPEPVPRWGRRRRERAEAINVLRQACAQAIHEIDASGEQPA